MAWLFLTRFIWSRCVALAGALDARPPCLCPLFFFRSLCGGGGLLYRVCLWTALLPALCFFSLSVGPAPARAPPLSDNVKRPGKKNRGKPAKSPATVGIFFSSFFKGC
nr:hypothetical protein [Pandoravirus massiliensis]